MHQATVVLGFPDHALQEEVLHFLERRQRIRVVGAVADEPGLARTLRETEPDAVVVSTDLLARAPVLDGAAVMAVAERESLHGLRAALRAGARGFYVWPEDRDRLGTDTERLGRRPPPAEEGRGRIVAVHGPRGGAGTTFLATNLAAASAAAGLRTCLIDFDLFYADVSGAIGVAGNAEVPTSVDLVPVTDELSADHLERVLYQHPRGFQVLLAPQDPLAVDGLRTEHLARAAAVARERFDLVLLHLPRSIEEARPGLETADQIVLVVTLDVLAFRDARRTLTLLEREGLRDRCRLVVNRATRAEVLPQDAERVFGLEPIAVFRTDRAVTRAQNRGELLPGRGSGTARALAALAARVQTASDDAEDAATKDRGRRRGARK